MNLKGKSRYVFCIVLIVFIFSCYVVRLVDWQIVNGEVYRERANRSSIYRNKTDALRGEILDVNGVGFVENLTGYKILIDRFALPAEKENQTILDLIALLKLKNEPFIDELPIKLISGGQFEFVEGKEKEIKELKGKNRLNLNSYSTASECMEKLAKKYNCGNFEPKIKRDIVSVKYNMDVNGYYDSMASSYIFADDISSELLMIISEKFQDNQGVRIGLSAKRQPVNSDLAPHIIGSVGKISEEQYETFKDKGYSLADIVGKSGIESVMEEYLHGVAGEKKVEVAKDGSVLHTPNAKEAKPGNTIYLTIDSRLQKAANESLARAVRSSGQYDCVAGGVVALSVKDFSVLAAATYPSYDLAKLSEPGYYSQLVNDKTNPLFNRAFQGVFAPGSIFKPLVACGALEEGVLTPEDKVKCVGIYHYPGHNFTTKCLGVHGNADLTYAMAKSCNVYFSEVGRRLGIENMNLYSKKFGLGVKTGIELTETAGVLAGPEYSKSIGSRWSNLVTIKAAIGQSDNQFSPLQLATYVATIASGGNRYRTHLIRKITDYRRENIIMENNPDTPELIDTSGVSQEHLNMVKNAMRQVVLSGTATNFNNYIVPIAAKTGTAQNSGSDHTTFICFAPYENPEIAIVVIVENGGHGNYTAEVVRDIMEEYFGMNVQTIEEDMTAEPYVQIMN